MDLSWILTKSRFHFKNHDYKKNPQETDMFWEYLMSDMWVLVIYYSITDWKNLPNNYFLGITLCTKNVITDHPMGANNK